MECVLFGHFFALHAKTKSEWKRKTSIKKQETSNVLNHEERAAFALPRGWWRRFMTSHGGVRAGHSLEHRPAHSLSLPSALHLASVTQRRFLVAKHRI